VTDLIFDFYGFSNSLMPQYLTVQFVPCMIDDICVFPTKFDSLYKIYASDYLNEPFRIDNTLKSLPDGKTCSEGCYWLVQASLENLEVLRSAKESFFYMNFTEKVDS
jgi:hypothetical protein